MFSVVDSGDIEDSQMCKFVFVSINRRLMLLFYHRKIAVVCFVHFHSIMYVISKLEPWASKTTWN